MAKKEGKSNKNKIITVLLGVSFFCIFSLLLLSFFNHEWLTGIVNRSQNDDDIIEKQNDEELDEDSNESEEEVKVIDESKGISYTTKDIHLVHLNFNDKDLADKIWNKNIEVIDYELKPDFIIFNIAGFWTCGSGEDEILITDYEGNILYHNEQTKESNSSIKSELVYKGEYKYKDSEKTLFLTYRALCDFDCNSCQEFMNIDDVCTIYPKYKDLVVSKEYKISYKDGKFASNKELVNETKLANDEYFSQIFDCK